MITTKQQHLEIIPRGGVWEQDWRTSKKRGPGNKEQIKRN
jgi:hypothetical protein